MESPAMSLVSSHLPKNGVPEMRNGLNLARDHYLPKGITAVHDARIGTYDEVRAYAGAIADGELPIRTYLMISPELYDAELEAQAMQPALLVGSEFGVGIDLSCASVEKCLQTIFPHFTGQTLLQPLDLQGQSGQLVQQTVPKRGLDRFACCSGAIDLHHLTSGVSTLCYLPT
jgi:hypothetical protein